MRSPDAEPPTPHSGRELGDEAPRALIGLEIHARLATRSKLFCGCENGSGGSPNSRICPVCTGFPGTLPYPNLEAIRLAVRAARLLSCELSEVSHWSRKHYFYPDLPKGYQITQQESPLARGGVVAFSARDGSWREVRLRGLHVEEDAGKLVHTGLGEGVSGVDFNRCGVPLVEIVTEPCLHDPDDAARLLEQVRAILRAGDVSDANMEQGSLRCDANVSLARPGAAGGARVEIKNMNSFRFVRAALKHEIERQRALLASGREVLRETRQWDAAAGVTRAMRSKEDLRDYRYLADPDLPPLVLDTELVASASGALPPLPIERERALRQAGFRPENARRVALDPDASAFLDAARRAGASAHALETWMLVELGGRLAERGQDWSENTLAAGALVELIRAVEERRITATQAKELLAASLEEGCAPLEIAERDQVEALCDPEALDVLVADTLAAHPAQVEQYRAGKSALLGFFVGRVLEASGGRAEARLARKALLDALDEKG